MPLRELLIAGRAVIANPEHWTQRWFSRAKDGTQVFPDSPKAHCFCSVGALGKVTPSIALRGEAHRLLSQVAGMSIVRFNDEHTHAEVLEVWDRAIALADHE